MSAETTQPRIHEASKKAGLCYALTDEGVELPVLDITRPEFDVRMTEAEISAVIDATLQSMRASATVPAEAARAAVEQSLLLRGVRDSAGTFMTGMMTYLHRLGPDNLGAWASEVDRRVAGSMMALSFRFRLRDVARLLADFLAPALAANRDRPLELLNIAGGPAMDSINALLLLRKEHPETLAARAVRIRVLDIDAAGPRFGARAVKALQQPGAGLEALDVTLEHVAYDWTDTASLRGILADIAPGALCAGSTEGGLFDYGSDETIVANLEALRAATPPDFAMVGSVVRDVTTLDPRLRVTVNVANRPIIRYLGMEAFSRLARSTGWSVERSLDSTAHHVVRLKKG